MPSLRSEFKLAKLKFSNVSPELFYSSQWPIGNTAFLAYKMIVAIYNFVIVLYSIHGFAYHMEPRRPWPVWLTNWSYLVLASYSISSCVMISYNYFTCYKPSKLPVSKTGKKTPFFIKLIWFFFAIAAPMSYLVTIVYFVTLFPRKKLNFIPAGDLNMHLMNSVLTTLEILISAFPLRLMHIVYPILFGFVYVVFSLFYWLPDKVNNVLYPGVIDWTEPGDTIVTLLVMCFCMIPLIHMLQFFIVRLRIWIFQKISSSPRFYDNSFMQD